MPKVDKLLIKYLQDEYKCSYSESMSKHLINLKNSKCKILFSINKNVLTEHIYKDYINKDYINNTHDRKILTITNF